MDKDVYIAHGHKNRKDYLKSLDIPYSTVEACSSVLGPSEDFDGLVTHLEDEFS